MSEREMNNFKLWLQSPRISIEESKITFDATGEGAHGENEYHFELDLPHEINPKVLLTATSTISIITDITGVFLILYVAEK